MSDAENQPKKPTPETSAVPLKKETIRVTLRANPDASTPASPAAPAPQAPQAPKAPAPAPTIPIGGGAPKPAAPAPTVRLNTPSKPITPGAAPATAAPTKPLQTGGPAPAAPGASQPLPKATVNLGTTPMASTPGAAASGDTTQNTTMVGETGELALKEENKTLPLVFSIVLFLAALAVIYITYQTNQLVPTPAF